MKYQESHEWAKKEKDHITVGISEHAAEALSDVVFVELPDVGDALDKGEAFMSIESVKAASDIFAPVDGEVIEVNELLEEEPEQVNESPLEKGWLIKIKPSDWTQYEELMSFDDYSASIEK